MKTIIVNGIEYRQVEINGRTKLISKDGMALNPIKRNQKATTHLNKDGYLCFGGGIPVHLYVAYGWVDGYFEGAEVNHIDYNRTNNSASNLEWVTHQENVKHSSKVGHYSRYGDRNSRCVPVIATNNGQEFEFGYIEECAKWLKEELLLDRSIGTIHECIIKSAKKGVPYKGFTFKVKE